MGRPSAAYRLCARLTLEAEAAGSRLSLESRVDQRGELVAELWLNAV